MPIGSKTTYSNPAYSIDESVLAKSITVSPGIYDSLSVKISKTSDSVSVDEESSSSAIMNFVFTELSPKEMETS